MFGSISIRNYKWFNRRLLKSKKFDCLFQYVCPGRLYEEKWRLYHVYNLFNAQSNYNIICILSKNQRSLTVYLSRCTELNNSIMKLTSLFKSIFPIISDKWRRRDFENQRSLTVYSSRYARWCKTKYRLYTTCLMHSPTTI